MSAKDLLRKSWRKASPATLLYTPANEREKIAKIAGFGADAAILDLEDAVALDEKTAARTTARNGLASLPRDLLRLVRVNDLSTSLTLADVAGVMCADLDGIVYPKVETAAQLWDIDSVLAAAEHEHGIPTGSTILIALIETARGVSNIGTILKNVPERLLTVGFGPGDFCVDMGIELDDHATQLDYPRARIAIAAKAADLAPAVDGPWLALHDFDGLVTDSKRSKSFGFAGRQLIYPAHVPRAADVYVGVSEAALERYCEVISAFEASLAAGKAAVQVHGSLVDYPIYEHALRVVDASHRRRRSEAHPYPTKEIE